MMSHVLSAYVVIVAAHKAPDCCRPAASVAISTESCRPAASVTASAECCRPAASAVVCSETKKSLLLLCAVLSAGHSVSLDHYHFVMHCSIPFCTAIRPLPLLSLLSATVPLLGCCRPAAYSTPVSPQCAVPPLPLLPPMRAAVPLLPLLPPLSGAVPPLPVLPPMRAAVPLLPLLSPLSAAVPTPLLCLSLFFYRPAH